MTPSGKRAINLTVDSALIDEARKYGLSLSPIAEDAIRSAVKREASLRWREENRDAVKAYNSWIEKNGVFGDEFRDW